MNKQKLLRRALAGSQNIRFGEMVGLIEAFGFHLARIRGSHHIFEHPEVQELVNVQNWKGKAKRYQVRQFLQLIERYRLQLSEEQ
jgi:predicted RNA binding protein YcfA (HicA-like mRNA interferase family)